MYLRICNSTCSLWFVVRAVSDMLYAQSLICCTRDLYRSLIGFIFIHWRERPGDFGHIAELVKGDNYRCDRVSSHIFSNLSQKRVADAISFQFFKLLTLSPTNLLLYLTYSCALSPLSPLYVALILLYFCSILLYSCAPLRSPRSILLYSCSISPYSCSILLYSCSNSPLSPLSPFISATYSLTKSTHLFKKIPTGEASTKQAMLLIVYGLAVKWSDSLVSSHVSLNANKNSLPNLYSSFALA